jgi:hypothetical protein
LVRVLHELIGFRENDFDCHKGILNRPPSQATNVLSTWPALGKWVALKKATASRTNFNLANRSTGLKQSRRLQVS